MTSNPPLKESSVSSETSLDELATEIASKWNNLDAAWKEAEDALPEYWFVRSLTLLNPYTTPIWEVVAADSRSIVIGKGPTPAAALLALAARLRETPR